MKLMSFVASGVLVAAALAQTTPTHADVTQKQPEVV